MSVEVMESYREELLKTAPYHVCSTQLCLTHAQSIREVLNGFMDEGRLYNHWRRGRGRWRAMCEASVLWQTLVWDVMLTLLGLSGSSSTSCLCKRPRLCIVAAVDRCSSPHTVM